MGTDDHFDLVVIGGGPAGHAAALEGAALGARTALIEAESLGGQCVHATCIPNAIVGASATHFAEAQEQAMFGVFDAGDQFSLRRAGARREQLVEAMAGGVAASLRAVGCEVIAGRGTIDGSVVRVSDRALSWSSLVLATGSRWEPPNLPGVDPSRVTTPDGLHGLDGPPATAVVVAGGTGRTAFSLESAVMLALAGTDVTVLAEGPRLLPWLDDPASDAAVAALGGYGITVRHGGRAELAGASADLVIVPDERQPFLAGLGLPSLGVPDSICDVAPDVAIAAGVHVAGDATGRGFLTASAIADGRAAAGAALGNRVVAPPDALLVPHVLQLPELAWVGQTAEEAAAGGWDVLVVHHDLAHSAHALVAGARAGLLSLVVDRDLGVVLGAQCVGVGSAPIVGMVATAMQQEQTVEDLAAVVAFHPDPTEAVVDAARRAVVQRRAVGPEVVVTPGCDR